MHAREAKWYPVGGVHRRGWRLEKLAAMALLAWAAVTWWFMHD